jgi:hypothetical protein
MEVENNSTSSEGSINIGIVENQVDLPQRHPTPVHLPTERRRSFTPPLTRQNSIDMIHAQRQYSYPREEPTVRREVYGISPSRTIDENWSGANLETLSQWIQTSSFHIEALELVIIYYRSIVRQNVLLGLIFSTASGSISLSQMNSTEQQIVYNIIFIIMSFSIAIFTGLIKIYQIQEQLEEFIKLKQEWIGFSVTITTEVQLPVCQRKPALELITKHKNKYLDLLKRDIDIPYSIKNRAYKHLYDDKEVYLNNLKRYKKIKEIAYCTDETFFLSEARRLEKEDTGTVTTDKKKSKKWCFNEQNKDIDKKTSLSNILLYVIMDEENEQRTYKMIQLLNNIRERKSFLEDKLKEYNLVLSTDENRIVQTV